MALQEAVIEVTYKILDKPLKRAEETARNTFREITRAATDSEEALAQVGQGTSSLSSDLARVDRAADEMSESLEDVGDGTSELTRDFDRIGDSAREVGREADRGLRDLEEGTEEARRAADRLDPALDEVADSARESGNAASDAGSQWEGLSGAFEGVKGLAGAAGIAFGAAEIFSSADNLTKAMNHFQASTGATTAEVEAFGEAAKDIYTSGTGESLDDIARSMANIKNVTGAGTDEVKAMTNSAMTLRDTFEWDVNESIRSVDMIMTQFGVDSNTAFGMLAQGAQLGLDQNQNLLDSFNEYSVHFKKMGFSASGMMNLFSKVAEKGVYDVDKIGDAVKEFSIRAIDGSKTTTEAFGTIGLNAQEMATAFTKGGDEANEAFIQVVKGLKAMKDPIAQDAAGVALFGTMWEDMGKEAVLAMADTTSSLGDASAAMDKINEVKYDDATTALTALGRLINVELGEVASSAVNNLKDTFIELKESGAIERVFDGIGTAVDAAVATFGALKDATMSTYNFISNNWSTLGPIFKGVAAAIMVVRGVQLAYNAGLKLQAALETARAVAVGISTGAIWANTAAMLANPYTWIVIAIVAVIAAIILCIVYWDEISAAVMSWVNIAMGWLQVAWDFIVWCFQGILTAVMVPINAVWNFLVTVWTAVWNFIGPLLTALFNLYVAIWSNIFQFIGVVLQGIWAVITRIWNAVWSFLQPVLMAIWNLIMARFNLIRSIVTTVMNAVRTVVVAAWNAIKSAVFPIITAIWDKVTTAFNEGLAFLKGLVSSFVNVGREIIQGLINGITEKLGELKDKVNAVGSTVIEGTKNLFQIHSPSRVMAEMGINIVKGQELGMLQELPNLSRVAGKVAGQGMPSYTPENTMAAGGTSISSTNNLAPVFNLTVNGGGSDREMEHKIKRWVADSLQEAFAGLSRSNPRLREV